MSDSSRKRARKSKLVPREYVEIDEENVTNLQIDPSNILQPLQTIKIEPENTSINQNACTTATETDHLPNDDFEALIDNETRQSVTKEPSREFSITIAVEEYDENSNDLVIDECYKEEQHTDDETTKDSVFFASKSPAILEESKDTINRVILNKTRPTANTTRTRALAEASKYSAIEFNKLVEPYILDREEILDTTNIILIESPNIADRLLAIEVKNCMGHFQRYTNSTFEDKIQKVLEQWQDWQKLLHPKYRSSPLFYKCYICKKSWWYLSGFSDHLKEHDEFKLDLEEYTLYEANVIAYNTVDEIMDVKQFATEGDCPKCGNTYSLHKKENRQSNDHYACRVSHCIKTFQTCFLLKFHEHTGHTFSELTGIVLTALQRKKNCSVCGLVFHTQTHYQEHMILMHSVRSDLVVAVTYKMCNLCQSKYVIRGSHDCPNKGITMQCKCCFRIFMPGLRYNSHQDIKMSTTCKICNETIPQWCMETEHMMTHTDNFVLVKKCILCNNFTVFLDDAAAAKHEYTEHIKNHYDTTPKTVLRYFDKILVPKSCIPLRAIAVKEERMEVPLAPELVIKQEVIDSLTNTGNANTNNTEDNAIAIKEEITYETHLDPDKMQETYSIKIEEPNEHSSIFGIKIEPQDIVKQETPDQESEYEDDIIRLDANFESSQESTQDSVQEIVQETTSEIIVIDDDDDMQDMEEDMQDMQEDEELLRRLPNMYRCSKCGYTAPHKDYKIHILSECSPTVENKGSYNCTKCNTNFKSMRKYIDHFIKHGLVKNSCPVCFKVYDWPTALLAHVSMHIRTRFVAVRTITLYYEICSEYKFECKLCKEHVVKPEFFEHWEKHLTIVEGKKGVAEWEAKSDVTRPIGDTLVQKLLSHLQSLELDKLRSGCIICHKYFSRRNDCKRHIIEHLLNDAYLHKPKYDSLKCQICDRGFQKPDNYKKHMRDHGSLPVYKCEICDKSFSDSSNFTKHKKLHNSNAYTCDICGKKFQAKYSIEKHMVIHETQKPITCTICNKVFYLASAFRKHNRMQHDKNALKFGCTICSTKFSCLKDKWEHMWHIHQERKHKADCLICSKSFRRYIDLKHHFTTEHKLAMKNAKNAKQKNTSQNVYDILKTTKIVGIGSKEETLIVYE